MAAPRPYIDGVPVGTLDVHVKSVHADYTVPAQFFVNYQKENPVWAEFTPTGTTTILQHEVEVSSPSQLEPFPAMTSGSIGRQSAGSLTFSMQIVPLLSAIESARVENLKEVSFALLDSPVTGELPAESHPKSLTLPCGQFDLRITQPNDAHSQVSEMLGSSPHRLSNSVVVTERFGQPFSSEEAKLVLNTFHTALSFAAGCWVGMTMVAATGETGDRLWFQWGTRLMSQKARGFCWYDPQHTEWLQPLCDAFLRLQSNEETWEPIKSALYWYQRSNTRGAGIDASLILSQCALELLSWFVIVKKTGALSEEGYGQLSSTSERLRLALTLLDIPRRVPAGLKDIAAIQQEMKWKDLADAVVQGRNYLVHPTQSRSGKRRATRDLPWYELWIGAQWLLELVILRLLEYPGSYHNRTKFKEFNRIDRVPWS